VVILDLNRSSCTDEEKRVYGIHRDDCKLCQDFALKRRQKREAAKNSSETPKPEQKKARSKSVDIPPKVQAAIVKAVKEAADAVVASNPESTVAPEATVVVAKSLTDAKDVKTVSQMAHQQDLERMKLDHSNKMELAKLSAMQELERLRATANSHSNDKKSN
jgi:hypothetical protein